jgi:hypothetical protein
MTTRRRYTLKEIAEQIKADLEDPNRRTRSRLTDNHKRLNQECLATLMTSSKHYGWMTGLYLNVSYTPDDLKELARQLCRLADDMRERQRRREANTQQHADWNETREILGD